METDAAALERAVAVLREQFGAQVPGALRQTQAAMGRALEQALGLDELAADRLVKQLIETGRLVYVDPAAGGAPVDPATAGGPIYDIPGALTPEGAERVTAAGTVAGVEATLGGVSTVSGQIGGTLPALEAARIAAPDTRAGAGVPPAATVAAAEAAQQDRTGGYWLIR